MMGKMLRLIYTPRVLPGWVVLLSLCLGYMLAALVADEVGLKVFDHMVSLLIMVILAVGGLIFGVLWALMRRGRGRHRTPATPTTLIALTSAATAATLSILVFGIVSHRLDKPVEEETSPKVNIYYTSAPDSKKFAANLTAPHPVTCPEFINALQSFTLQQPVEVEDNHAASDDEPLNKNDFRVIVFRSDLEPDNWLFRFEDAQTNCPSSITMMVYREVPVYEGVTVANGNTLIEDQAPIGAIACEDIEAYTLTKDVVPLELVDTHDNLLAGADYLRVENWSFGGDESGLALVYAPDIRRLCGIAEPTILITVVPSATPTFRVPVVVSGFADRSEFLNTDSIWEGLAFLDVKDAGQVNYKTTVPADATERIYFFWCATTEDNLNSAVANMDVRFEINAQEYDPTLRFFYREGGNFCHMWGIKVSNWQSGSQIIAEIIYEMKNAWADDGITYSAGTYIHQITIDVVE